MVASIASKICSRLIQSKNTILRRVPIYPVFINKRNNSYGNLLQSNTVRIGCASGFWGDTMTAAPQLIYGGGLDYLVLDYLSEITMSLLTAMKNKDSNAGYPVDFVQVVIAPHIKEIKKRGIKVISNAGGVNPEACAAALQAVCSQAGIDLNIAVVNGDDLVHRAPELQNQGVKEMYSGVSMPKSVTSVNAYLGAGPISRALDLGADIIVTGRCVDSALVLAPLVHKFKWGYEEFDKLAQGSLAGHLIECGAQVTGGIFTDWHTVPNWSNIGFPIVECAEDGNFVVTKPPKTGGIVSKATVAEQLLYEIGDPACYQLPDVNCDFTQVSLGDVDGHDGEAVFVSGARGVASSSQYKVSATYMDGYRMTAVCCVGGPRSKDKAERTAEAILKRTRAIFKQLKMADFSKVNIEILGSENNYGHNSKLPAGSREAVLWLAVHHPDKRALNILAREIAPAGTGMAPGLTGIVGGRPKVSPVLKLFSFLHDKDDLKIDIAMNGKHVETYTPPKVAQEGQSSGSPKQSEVKATGEVHIGSHSYRLEDLAYTRSGDKGNSCNIGVIARHPAYLPYIRQALTEVTVAEYFAHLLEADKGAKVDRYECPGIHGLNFVLHEALGGGGIASLRSDPQGKAYGQMMLDFEIHDMPALVDIINES
ncbi:uncharacterized protein LOC128227846 [Mya arenaria]|uniref:uncharacterized protein LOC128227846 n=1 Tax=Mya arenaria TaxID=6604 RepID=UPI0022E50465|nr:uncharacterized protein LOC128227846 [Mya arenaria]